MERNNGSSAEQNNTTQNKIGNDSRSASELAKVEKIKKGLGLTTYLTYALFSSLVLYYLMNIISFMPIGNDSEKHDRIILPLNVFFLSSIFFTLVSVWLGMWLTQFLEKRFELSKKSKLDVARKKLLLNERIINFLEISGWLFWVQTIIGIIMSVAIPDSQGDILFCSLQGIVGERFSDRIKQWRQSKAKILRKEEKKLLKELGELTEDNNNLAGKTINYQQPEKFESQVENDNNSSPQEQSSTQAQIQIPPKN